MFQMEKRHQVIILVLAAVILFSAGYKYALFKQSDNPGNGLVSEQQQAPGDTEKPADLKEIVVHVAGEVSKPGVYRLPPGSRIVDAINLAGPTANSALDNLNLAAPLEDGRQITVFNYENIKQQQVTGQAAAPGNTYAAQPGNVPGLTAGVGSGLININLAGPTELEELPGIGPALAQRIIDYRNQNGPFAAIEDITNVSGIGEKRFEQLKSKICVN